MKRAKRVEFVARVSIGGLLAVDASPTWVDFNGKTWRTPRILHRLKSRIPSHAALRDHVIARDVVCRGCGSTGRLVADHIISRRNGGAHHPDNMQALCNSCNARKTGLVDAVTK